MDEKEVDVSSAPHKRSKSVPAMSPAFLNATQLQDQPIVGRSRSNTVDSVERLVRTQRRGARLSSGGLLRNLSKKRRNKDALVKSRSVDVIDLDERDNSSRKSSNSSESSVHEDDRVLVRERKQGFCLPAVNGVVEKLSTMEDEQEFPNNIDSDQTKSSVVCSANEESFVGDQQLNSTNILHDDYEASKLSKGRKPYENSQPSKSTDNGQEREKLVQDVEPTFDRFPESKRNIRRKSLPADLSEYQIYSNLGDYSEGHEYRTRLMNISQTDMKFQDNYGIVYKKRCQNKLWRRWHSLPESLYKVNESGADSSTGEELVSDGLDVRDAEVLVQPVDQGLSNMQDSRQHQKNENCTSESYNEKVEDDDTMAAKPIREQQHSSNPEENLDTKDQVETTKRLSKIKRSFSLPLKFDIVDEDESQDKENVGLKRTKSLTTGDEFEEVFPVMLSEQTTGFKLDPGIENTDDKLQENNDDKNAVVKKKPRRVRGRDRRRAKSLPVTLALEEIPEETAEQYSCNEYESIDDMAKKHVNRAFQDLLRKIQRSHRPRNKVKRTRSLSTIKEATASNETLPDVESHQRDNDVTPEKACEKHEAQSTGHEQEHADLTSHDREHEPERDEQYEEHTNAAIDVNDNECQPISEESVNQEREENNDEVDHLQEPHEQDSVLVKEEEKSQEDKKIQEKNERPQLSEDADDKTLALKQELVHENNEAEELQMNNENEYPDNITQGTMINESVNERVKEKKQSIHKAKEELHIDLDVPQILVSEVEYEQGQLSVVDNSSSDVYDEVDGCEEQEGSGEQYINPQTEELKSPDDEDIQGTILEHINNIDFAFDCSINQRSLGNVSCMERIPEDPDKETAMESADTELEPTETESESEEIGDPTDIIKKQSTLKRAGSIRKGKGGLRGKMSGSSRKKSWPTTNESKCDQKRVTWSDFEFPRGTTKGEDEQMDQEDGFRDQYEPGPRGDFNFTGSGDVSEDVTQDEFEEGPRGEIRFTGSLDEHGYPVDQSDRYESDEIDFEPAESKFDILLRNAINSYLEPDYSQSESPIHRAVALDNVEHLRELIDEGLDVNALDEHGWPPLHVATLFNRIDCADLLLETGADLQGYTDSLVHEYQTLRERVC